MPTVSSSGAEDLPNRIAAFERKASALSQLKARFRRSSPKPAITTEEFRRLSPLDTIAEEDRDCVATVIREVLEMGYTSDIVSILTKDKRNLLRSPRYPAPV